MNKGQKRYALLGRRLDHSLSPRIHGLIFEYSPLRGSYELIPLEPEAVVDFVSGLGLSGIHGLNVTIPYKQTVIPALDGLSPEARDIGAVNTITYAGGRLMGYNTDYFGFMRTLENAGIPIRGKAALILGTGGSARAVCCALRDGGASHITLLSRNPDRAAGEFGEAQIMGYDALESDHSYDLLVNCTPVGMYPSPEGCPLEEEKITGFSSVVDLIYNPVETRLLKTARLHGARCANGLYMLIAQAVRAQEIWNGISLSDDVIDRVFNRLQPGEPGGNIVLIGMPGSGKTTVGRSLARTAGYDFVDLDALIESYGETIPELFARSEDAFRERETRAARQVGGMKRTVIATGGGIIKNPENMRILGESGIVVFLNRPVDAIDADIDYGTRPLLADGKTALWRLYEQRIMLYHQHADIIIDNEGGVDAAVKAILAQMKGDAFS